MGDTTNPTTCQKVPDTATTYERAKPADESVDGALKQPAAPPSHTPDSLARNAQPASPKQAEKKG